MDYSVSGTRASDEFAATNVMIPAVTAKQLTVAAIRCPKCGTIFMSEIVGSSSAQILIASCTNKKCENSGLPQQHKISRFWPINLSMCYITLITDTGFKGMQAFAWGSSITSMCRKAYTNHCNYIFRLFDKFYNKNILKAVESVKSFYLRNNLLTEKDLKSYHETGIMNITVSLDGAYQRRGRESTYCVTCCVDVWTGRSLTFAYQTKCFECKNCNIFRSHCSRGRFHGPSGNMEIVNAEQLFSESEALGLRYTHYVADGDCKILPHLKKLNPYGDEWPISKEECANHLSKRAYRAFKHFSEKWTNQTGKTLDLNYNKKLEKEAKSLGKGNKCKGKKGSKGESTLRGPDATQIDASLETIPLLPEVADALFVFLSNTDEPNIVPSAPVDPPEIVDHADDLGHQCDPGCGCSQDDPGDLDPSDIVQGGKDNQPDIGCSESTQLSDPTSIHTSDSSTQPSTTLQPPTSPLPSTSRGSTRRQAAVDAWSKIALKQPKNTTKSKSKNTRKKHTKKGPSDDWCKLLEAPSDCKSNVINDPSDELDGCVVFDHPTAVDPHPSPPLERRTRACRNKAPAKIQEFDLDISEDISSSDDSIKNPEYKLGESSKSRSRCVSHVDDIAAASQATSPVPKTDNTRPPLSESANDKNMISDTIYKHIVWDNIKPKWLVKKFSKKTKYRASIVLADSLVDLEKLYRLAVYQHYKDGWMAQRRAVFSILFHELDYNGTTTRQKAYYHRFCREGCDFYNHTVIKKLDPNTFVKSTTKKDYHKIVKPWEGGLLAGLDTEEPLCFKHLCGVFHTIAKKELMMRCKTLRTQNANESLHSRIFNIIHKMKFHGASRFQFGCQQVLLNHNFGLFNSSFLHCIGMMGESAKKDLAVLDTDSKRQSMRVWADPKQRASQGHASHRKKLPHRPIPPTAVSVENDPDDTGSQAPIQIPRHHRERKHQRFAKSGAYGEGD